MQLPQLDSVHAETFETSMKRGTQVLGPAVCDPLVRTRPVEPAFRCDDEVVRIRMQRLRDELFGDERTVRVGRVDEVHSELDGPSQNSNALASIGWRTKNSAAGDPHRTVCHAIDGEISSNRYRARGCGGRGGGCRT